MGVTIGYEKTYKRKDKGGMVIGIRKDLIEIGTEMVVEEKGLMIGYVRQGRERWRIIGVYVSGDIEQKLKKMERWMEDKTERVKTIIGKKFNAKTGEEGGEVVEGDGMEKNDRRRKSKDKRLDRESRIMMEFIEERGWRIYNGMV